MQGLSIDSVDNCPDWVREHPSLQPWDEGCRRMDNRLHSWRDEYYPRVCDQIPEDGCEDNRVLFRRQLNCWLHHWQTAGEDVDAHAVADSIVAGVGYIGNGDLGGNPLFDLVLALAVTRGHSKAAARFQDELFEEAKGRAAALAAVFSREDPLEWWTEFFDAMGGFTGQPAKLDRYDGRTGLRRFVLALLGNYLRNLLRKRGRRRAKEGELPETVRDATEEIPVERREDLATLSAIFQAAFRRLSSDAAALLSLYYERDLSNLEMAKLLGISAGTATRRRQRAEARFRELLFEEGERRSESFESVRARIASAGIDFAGQLFRVLKERDPEETP